MGNRTQRGHNDVGAMSGAVKSLWDLVAGMTPWLLVDYTNITSWPDAVVSGKPTFEAKAKTNALAASTAHVHFSGETHAAGEVEKRMIKWMLNLIIEILIYSLRRLWPFSGRA